jgi:uncharacterized membrane protein YfcA
MLEPWQWVLAALGAALAGLAKTGIAGLGILSVAVFASILPARESTGVLLVVLIAADVVAVRIYRREASWAHLVRLLPWTGLGILLGALAVGQMDDALVRRAIGGILVVLVAIHLLRHRPGAPTVPLSPRPPLVAATGLLAGFTTMIANAAGPLMVIYLLAMRLPKVIFVGTAAWFFLVVNLSKVPFSYALGLITPASLWTSARLIPFAVAGALSGRWVLGRMDQRVFESTALLLTLAAALRLLVA